MNDTPFYLAEDFSGPFPDTKLALTEPDGLLAVGGNLKPETLLQAYSQGLFPWYSDDQPILWWSPNPRCVLYPKKLKISQTATTIQSQVLKQQLKQQLRQALREPRIISIPTFRMPNINVTPKPRITYITTMEKP